MDFSPIHVYLAVTVQHVLFSVSNAVFLQVAPKGLSSPDNTVFNFNSFSMVGDGFVS